MQSAKHSDPRFIPVRHIYAIFSHLSHLAAVKPQACVAFRYHLTQIVLETGH